MFASIPTSSRFVSAAFILFAVAMCLPAGAVFAEDFEPEFIGEAYAIATDGTPKALDKELAEFTSGISWSSNSWNATSLQVPGGKAQTRFSRDQPLQLVVRAVDNQSDPLTVVSVYTFKSKRKSRQVVLSENNSGNLMKSQTHTKDLVRFSGRKHGESSYLISLSDLPPGEYGIVVANPNATDSKRVVVSCVGVDLWAKGRESRLQR